MERRLELDNWVIHILQLIYQWNSIFFFIMEIISTEMYQKDPPIYFNIWVDAGKFWPSLRSMLLGWSKATWSCGCGEIVTCYNPFSLAVLGYRHPNHDIQRRPTTGNLAKAAEFWAQISLKFLTIPDKTWLEFHGCFPNDLQFGCIFAYR
jgi:hypothetical protein